MMYEYPLIEEPTTDSLSNGVQRMAFILSLWGSGEISNLGVTIQSLTRLSKNSGIHAKIEDFEISGSSPDSPTKRYLQK